MTSETADLIRRIIDPLTWVAVIVTAYLILDWIHDDDDPDGYA